MTDTVWGWLIAVALMALLQVCAYIQGNRPDHCPGSLRAYLREDAWRDVARDLAHLRAVFAMLHRWTRVRRVAPQTLVAPVPVVGAASALPRRGDQATTSATVSYPSHGDAVSRQQSEPVAYARDGRSSIATGSDSPPGPSAPPGARRAARSQSPSNLMVDCPSRAGSELTSDFPDSIPPGYRGPIPEQPARPQWDGAPNSGTVSRYTDARHVTLSGLVEYPATGLPPVSSISQGAASQSDAPTLAEAGSGRHATLPDRMETETAVPFVWSGQGGPKTTTEVRPTQSRTSVVCHPWGGKS